MSSDFSGYVSFSGTETECRLLMLAIRDMEIQQLENYNNKKNGRRSSGPCWYIETDLGDILEDENKMLSYIRDNKCNICINFSGPWGYVGGPLELFDMFKMIADIAPKSNFEGDITGSDPGADMGVKVSLDNGVMRRWAYYYEYGDECNEDDKWWEEKSYIPLPK